MTTNKDYYTKEEMNDVIRFHDKNMIEKISAFFEENLDDYFEDYLLRKYDITSEQLVSALKHLFPENFI